MLPARERCHWWSWRTANTNVHSCLVTRGAKIYLYREDDRTSTGRFRKLVLRIDFGEGRWPLCALELGPRALRTSEEREKLCAKGLMVSLRPGQYLKTSPVRMMLFPLQILSRFFSLSLSCGSAQNRFGPRLDDGGTLFRN